MFPLFPRALAPLAIPVMAAALGGPLAAVIGVALAAVAIAFGEVPLRVLVTPSEVRFEYIAFPRVVRCAAVEHVLAEVMWRSVEFSAKNRLGLLRPDAKVPRSGDDDLLVAVRAAGMRVVKST